MIVRILSAVLVLLVASPPSIAQPPPRDLGEAVAVAVRPGWREPDGRHVAGLAIRLAPGWKTYWRAPGRSGIAPRFDWRRSRNVAAVTPVWPRPTVLDQGDERTIGFDGDFVLPLMIQPRDPARPMRLRGTLDIGVCAEVCVPARLRVDAALLPDGEPDGAIRAALSDRPMAVRGATCVLVHHRGGLALSVELAAPPLGAPEVVAFEGPDLWFGDAEVDRRDGVLHAVVPIADPSSGPVALDRARLRITAIGSARAVETLGCLGG